MTQAKKSTKSPAKTKKAPASTRRRRSPELARQEILDAAEALFRAHNPEAIGLKEVARAAGVSHALVTHYFGTYAGLVEAVLLRCQTALRDTILEKLKTAVPTRDRRPVLDAFFAMLEDPLLMKLWFWARATERAENKELQLFRAQSLHLLVDLLAARHLAVQPQLDPVVLRERLTLGLMVVISAAHGYVIGKREFAAALGRESSPELDAAFRKTLGDMLFAYLPPPSVLVSSS